MSDDSATYFTDGDSLWELTGSDSDGNFYLMDCSLPADSKTAEPITVTAKELSQGFLRVYPK